MNPVIANLSTDNDNLRFTLSGVNVSIANAIRRIIISEIPAIVFKTTPNELSRAVIYTNTTRMNNELLKQRLSCIPIHIQDLSFPIQDYIVEIRRKNESDTIEYVTTGDFRVKDIKNDTYLSETDQKRIFPISPITGAYIDFARLRPRISHEIPGEELNMSCGLSIGTAKEDGAFNVASTCAYAATMDTVAANVELTRRIKDMKTAGEEASIIERTQKDFQALEAKRFIKPDSFDFIIETVGVFSNETLVNTACQVMIKKLHTFQQQIESDRTTIRALSMENTIENGFDIILVNEDYTLGKVLEYIMYSTHFGKVLGFCGFQKPHPHRSVSFLRLGFIQNIEKAEVSSYLTHAVASAIVVFERIGGEFEI